MHHKRFISFALLLVLIAANMRIAIIVIPPLTTMLQHSLGLSTSEIGSLTSIPLLCFGVFSAIGSFIIKRIGLHTTLMTGLIVLTIANFVRIYSPTLLFIGTLFVGLAIAVLNIGVPILVLSWFPREQIRLNGLYTASLNLFAAIVAGGSAATAQHLGWQTTVQLVSIPALLAVIYLTVFLLRTPKQASQPHAVAVPATKQDSPSSVYKNNAVWLLMVFMGAQSAIYYAAVAWLPSLLTSHGLTATTSNLIFGVFQIIGVPFSYWAPRFFTGYKQLRIGLILILLGYLIGLAPFLLNSGTLVLTLATMVLGATTAAIFSLALSLITILANNPDEAGQIGGLAQSGGYLIASISPVLLGVLQSHTHSWTIIVVVLMVLAVINISIGFVLNRVHFKHA